MLPTGMADELDFIRPRLDAFAAYLAAQPDPRASEWHVTHELFFASEESRSAAERDLEVHGLFTSYLDTLEGDDRPWWLEMMESIPPDAAELGERLRRVVGVLTRHDGDYNGFGCIGSRDESFHP